MANVGGRRRAGERTFSHKPVVIEIVPSLAWTEDDNNHYLLVDLPEFKNNEVKFQADTSEHRITVSGERLVGDKTKIIRFEQTLNLPSNSDVEEITDKFEGGILYVTVAKRAVVDGREIVSGNSDGIVEETTQSRDTNKDENAKVYDDQDHWGQSNKEESPQPVDEDHGRLQGCYDDKKDKNPKVDSFAGELVEKWGKEPSPTEWAIKVLKRNKGIVLTAIVAFSLGVMVSRNFGSASRPEQC